MSAPIAYPYWYTGTWPDAELLVEDALAPFLPLVSVTNPDGSVRSPTAYAAIPGDYLDMLPIVPIYRIPGPVGDMPIGDAALMEIGAIASTRDQAWGVLGFVVEMLLAIPEGSAVKRADNSWTVIVKTERAAGPELLTEFAPGETRLVTQHVNVVTRRPRTVPDYGPVVAQVLAGQVAQLDARDVSASVDSGSV